MSPRWADELVEASFGESAWQGGRRCHSYRGLPLFFSRKIAPQRQHLCQRNPQDAVSAMLDCGGALYMGGHIGVERGRRGI